MRTVGNGRRRIRSLSSRSLKSKTNVIVQRDPLSVSILVFICTQTATDRRDGYRSERRIHSLEKRDADNNLLPRTFLLSDTIGSSKKIESFRGAE